MGHYLGENADEVFLMARWMPWRNLLVKASVWHARKGPEHVYEIINGNANVTGLKFMESVDWQRTGASLDLNWEVINDAALFTVITHTSTSGNPAYNPDYLAGTLTTIELGFRVGW